MNLSNYENYRSYLNDVFFERRRLNANYSLRKFARSLRLSPGMLSSVLRGQKGISPQRAREVADHLELIGIERSIFCDIVQAEESRSPRLREESKTRLSYLREAAHSTQTPAKSTLNMELKAEILEMISHWYYAAILDFADLDKVIYDPYIIAERLNLPVSVIRDAVFRLQRLHLLKADENGSMRKTKNQLTTSHDIPSPAIRQCTAEFLDKAKEALHTHAIETRDFSTITMAIDKKRLTEAKRRIQNFRRELMHFLEGGEKRDGLYSLNIQLFSLLQPENPA